MFDRWGFRLQAPEGDGGAGAGKGDGKPDAMEAARKALNKNRNATRLVAQLMQERFEQREEIRELRSQLTEGAVPKGGKVLTAEQAKLWEKVEAFGKPDAVEKALGEHADLSKFKADTESTSATRNVARSMGWEPDVLVDITNARGLEFEDRELTVRDSASGKEEKKRLPHVRVRGAKDGKWEPLGDYAGRELKAYETALKAKTNGGGGSSTAVPFPAQPSHDQGSGGKDMTGAFIDRMYGEPKKEPAK